MTHNQWLLIFRVSGAVLALSLIGLVASIGMEVVWLCWFTGGASASVCITAAYRLRDVDRLQATKEAAWLKDHNAPDVSNAHDGDDD